jgi:hypothetical protein
MWITLEMISKTLLVLQLMGAVAFVSPQQDAKCILGQILMEVLAGSRVKKLVQPSKMVLYLVPSTIKYHVVYTACNLCIFSLLSIFMSIFDRFFSFFSIFSNLKAPAF